MQSPKSEKEPSPDTAEPRHAELFTPIHLKTHDDLQFPKDESAYLLLAGNGLWFCRNHDFFVSSVRARSWPGELAPHRESLILRHPRISRKLLERIVGFFDIIARRAGCEAGVLLAWHKQRRAIQLIVPDQVASVNRGWSGKHFPIDLNYEVPTDLGPNLSIIGDVHSHVYESAYSSSQDKSDEVYRPGLHLVVGRLDREPPDFHAEYVIDGTRFNLKLEQVIKGYGCRKKSVPNEWLERVKLKVYGGSRQNEYSRDSDYNHNSKWKK